MGYINTQAKSVEEGICVQPTKKFKKSLVYLGLWAAGVGVNVKPRKELSQIEEKFAGTKKIRVQLSLSLEKRYWDAVRYIAGVAFQHNIGKKLAVSRAVETLVIAALMGPDRGESRHWSSAEVREAGLSVVRANWFRHAESDGAEEEI